MAVCDNTTAPYKHVILSPDDGLLSRNMLCFYFNFNNNMQTTIKEMCDGS
jgi:hypothetical protein